MQIIATPKGTDFDAAASVQAAKILYPETVAVLPKSLNLNVKAFLSIHKDLQDCIRSPAMMAQTEVAPAGHTGKNHTNVCCNEPESLGPWFEGG